MNSKLQAVMMTAVMMGSFAWAQAAHVRGPIDIEQPQPPAPRPTAAPTPPPPPAASGGLYASDEDAQVLMIYDVRDIAAMLRPAAQLGASPEGVPMLRDIPIIGQMFTNRNRVREDAINAGGGGAPAPAPRPTSVFDELAAATNMPAHYISEGVLVAEGTKGQHEVFRRLLQQLRTVDGGSYEVEIAVTKAAAGTQVEIGQPFNATGDTARVKQAVRGRTETLVQATETTTYLSDWVPVVGTSSVGYQSQTKELVSGLRAAVSVSPGIGGGGKVDLRINGTLDHGSVKMTKNPVLGMGGKADAASGGGVPSDLGIGLPVVQSRSVQGELEVPLDQAIAVGMGPGFEGADGGSLVVTVRVRQLRAPVGLDRAK